MYSLRLAFGTLEQPVSQSLTGCFFLLMAFVAKKWQAKLAKEITKAVNKYPYKEPFLSKPADNDLANQWVVEYGIWSERDPLLFE